LFILLGDLDDLSKINALSNKPLSIEDIFPSAPKVRNCLFAILEKVVCESETNDKNSLSHRQFYLYMFTFTKLKSTIRQLFLDYRSIGQGNAMELQRFVDTPSFRYAFEGACEL
jgi:hypothetical protein